MFREWERERDVDIPWLWILWILHEQSKVCVSMKGEERNLRKSWSSGLQEWFYFITLIFASIFCDSKRDAWVGYAFLFLFQPFFITHALLLLLPLIIPSTNWRNYNRLSNHLMQYFRGFFLPFFGINVMIVRANLSPRTSTNPSSSDLKDAQPHIDLVYLSIFKLLNCSPQGLNPGWKGKGKFFFFLFSFLENI